MSSLQALRIELLVAKEQTQILEQLAAHLADELQAHKTQLRSLEAALNNLRDTTDPATSASKISANQTDAPAIPTPYTPLMLLDFHQQSAWVVDDNAINLEIAQEMLLDFNLQVTTCLSGAEAIERISTQTPAILFMDILMPECDGLETTRVIRARCPHLADVPIVAMTANNSTQDMQDAKAAGMQGYLTKPLHMSALGQELERWLRHSPPGNRVLTHEPIAAIPKTEDHQDELPGVDLADALKRLRGNRKLFNDVFLSFAQGCSSVMTELQEAINNLAYEEATRITHRLKGTAGNLSAKNLSAIAGEIEQLSKQQQTAPEHLLKQLEAALQQIISSAKLLASQQAPLAASERNNSPTETPAPIALAQRILEQIEIDLGDAQDDVEQLFELTKNTKHETFGNQVRAEFYSFNIRRLKTDIAEWIKVQAPRHEH